MAMRMNSVKWKETELDQKIQLQQLEIERQRIISRRFYITIWLLASFTLIGFGVYGLAIDNQGLGLTCLIWGLFGVIGGCEFLAVRAIIKYIRKNRQQKNK